jgi:tRNA pseudouridine13 synthase
MKLKCVPEDFEVEELADVALGDGPFAVYRLTKRGIGTPEAISSIQRRWKLHRRQISYGGLKDKHAVTRQWVTIHRGPRRDLKQERLALEYQGQSTQPFGPQDILGNRFRIVVRDLAESAAQKLLAQIRSLPSVGVPNYFDDQRFGSLGVSGEFIAKPWCRGNYERALWLAIAEANPHDRPHDREEKRILRESWGKWEACKAALPKSSRRSIVTFLVDHPTDFRRAFALLPVDLRSLYLAAFQSELWNRCLAAWLRERVPAEQLRAIELGTGRFPFPRELPDGHSEELFAQQLPLPSARLHLENGPLLDLYESVLAAEGTALRELRVKYPRDSFFSKGDRAAMLRVSPDVAADADDELYAGRRRVTLQFSLPRGAYATIVVKALTAE